MEGKNSQDTATIYFSKRIQDILNAIDFSALGNRVGIKTHFGEKGCVTYLDPAIVKAVYDKVTSLGKHASLIECNVLYKGSRTRASDHIATAKEHGFDFAPIDILDGENGDKYLELDVPENGLVGKARVGKGLQDYDSLIVLSHYKGHIAAGTGGSFKNLGMGLGSRSGKLHMHSDLSPSIRKEKCIACGACINNCDFNAISYVDDGSGDKKAEIDPEKCVGCAMCIAVCPESAVKVPWGGSSNVDLQKKIVDYTQAIIEYLGKEHITYINVLENITPNCDCDSRAQEPMIEDVGITAGSDPVAIDKASFDLVQRHSDGRFERINSVDKSVQVEYGLKRGLGTDRYELVDLQ